MGKSKSKTCRTSKRVGRVSNQIEAIVTIDEAGRWCCPRRRGPGQASTPAINSRCELEQGRSRLLPLAGQGGGNGGDDRRNVELAYGCIFRVGQVNYIGEYHGSRNRGYCAGAIRIGGQERLVRASMRAFVRLPRRSAIPSKNWLPYPPKPTWAFPAATPRPTPA